MNYYYEDVAEILAAPTLIPEGEEADFSHLEDKKLNKEWTKQFLAKKPYKTSKVSGFQVWNFDLPHGKEIVATPSDNKSTVFNMEYMIENLPLLGIQSLCQIKLWRDRSQDGTKIFPTRMIDTALKKVPAVICDSRQTLGGKKFWLHLMQRSIRQGLVVGFLNFAERTRSVCIDPDRFAEWMMDHEKYWKYSDDRYMNYRFFIARPVPQLEV